MTKDNSCTFTTYEKTRLIQLRACNDNELSDEELREKQTLITKMLWAVQAGRDPTK